MAGRDTIYALSSAAGRAGVAVLRVSGPGARAGIESLTQASTPSPRRAELRSVARGGEIIDQALVLWFPAPASFTGEDVAEFHVHGGRAVVDAVLQALGDLPEFRPAEPGEFTRRAVENGKFGLTQAEALADLIDAETDAQRRQALRQYEGALAEIYDGWRARLIRAAAWAEAGIDFSDEELPGDVMARARAEAREILQEIQTYMDDSRAGEILRDGLRLTVIGPPNAGKSSLVNALARRDVAIVAETPGTTRDAIEVHLNLGGYPMILTDTAGLRNAAEAVEAEGVRRALARAAASDIVVLVLDGSAVDPAAGLAPEMAALANTPPSPWPGMTRRPGGRASASPREDGWSARGPAMESGGDFARAGQTVLLVWNKVDLPWPGQRSGLRVSAATGEGLDSLLAALTELARERLDRPREAPPITRARHRHSLQHATEALTRAVAEGAAPELMAEDLRLALRALGRITGRVDIEELLDVIFRDFCIGK
jgi:tRNA modification GTPase